MADRAIGARLRRSAAFLPEAIVGAGLWAVRPIAMFAPYWASIHLLL
ncbi:MAG: hypothetical protein ABI652_02570 [Acidobacteriota bacterium]